MSSLIPIAQLNGSLSPEPTLSGQMTVPINTGGDPYTGSYTATPDPYDETVLDTKNKYLSNNVVIQKIPYFETSNSSSGTTVYIGGY